MRLRLPRFLSICLLLAACGGEDRMPPEDFARDVAATLAAGDFDAFWALNSQTVQLLAEGKGPMPTEGIASAVAPWNERKIQGDFERVVKTGRLGGAQLAGLEPVVIATEMERWTLELFDADGRGLGVAMQLRKWHDSYRVLTVYPVPPGRDRASVVPVEG